MRKEPVVAYFRCYPTHLL